MAGGREGAAVATSIRMRAPVLTPTPASRSGPWKEGGRPGVPRSVRPVDASGPGDTTPRIMNNKEGKSCRTRRPEAPLRSHEKGNGGARPRRCTGRCATRTPTSTCCRNTGTRRAPDRRRPRSTGCAPSSPASRSWSPASWSPVSRLPVLRQVPLEPAGLPPAVAGAGDQWRYKTLRTDLDLGGGRVLSAYNLHLPVQLSPEHGPFDGDFYRVLREQHAQREPQWRALARDVGSNPHPVLLAGDLNTSPAMGDLRKLPDGLRDAGHAMPSLYPARAQTPAGRDRSPGPAAGSGPPDAVRARPRRHTGDAGLPFPARSAPPRAPAPRTSAGTSRATGRRTRHRRSPRPSECRGARWTCP